MEKARIWTITISLLIGIVIGLFAAPSLWKGVGDAIAADEKTKQQNIATAKVAMQGKKVFLADEDHYTSASAHMLVALGASYSTKDEADYLISVETKKRIGFRDLYFRNGSGQLLYKVGVGEKGVAENEAFYFALSMAPAKTQ